MPGGPDGTPQPAGALATGPGGDVGAQSSHDRQPEVRADRAPRAALSHAVRVSGPAGGDRRACHPSVWMGARSGPLALLFALPVCVVRLRPLPVAGEPRAGGDVLPTLPRAAPAGETRHGRRPRKPLAPAPQCLVAAGGAAHVARPAPDVGGSTPEGIRDGLEGSRTRALTDRAHEPRGRRTRGTLPKRKGRSGARPEYQEAAVA